MYRTTATLQHLFLHYPRHNGPVLQKASAIFFHSMKPQSCTQIFCTVLISFLSSSVLSKPKSSLTPRLQTLAFPTFLQLLPLLLSLRDCYSHFPASSLAHKPPPILLVKCQQLGSPFLKHPTPLVPQCAPRSYSSCPKERRLREWGLGNGRSGK